MKILTRNRPIRIACHSRLCRIALIVIFFIPAQIQASGQSRVDALRAIIARTIANPNLYTVTLATTQGIKKITKKLPGISQAIEFEAKHDAYSFSVYVDQRLDHQLVNQVKKHINAANLIGPDDRITFTRQRMFGNFFDRKPVPIIVQTPTPQPAADSRPGFKAKNSEKRPNEDEENDDLFGETTASTSVTMQHPRTHSNFFPWLMTAISLLVGAAMTFILWRQNQTLNHVLSSGSIPSTPINSALTTPVQAQSATVSQAAARQSTPTNAPQHATSTQTMPSEILSRKASDSFTSNNNPTANKAPPAVPATPSIAELATLPELPTPPLPNIAPPPPSDTAHATVVMPMPTINPLTFVDEDDHEAIPPSPTESPLEFSFASTPTPPQPDSPPAPVEQTATGLKAIKKIFPPAATATAPGETPHEPFSPSPTFSLPHLNISFDLNQMSLLISHLFICNYDDEARCIEILKDQPESDRLFQLLGHEFPCLSLWERIDPLALKPVLVMLHERQIAMFLRYKNITDSDLFVDASIKKEVDEQLESLDIANTEEISAIMNTLKRQVVKRYKHDPIQFYKSSDRTSAA